MVLKAFVGDDGLSGLGSSSRMSEQVESKIMKLSFSVWIKHFYSWGKNCSLDYLTDRFVM